VIVIDSGIISGGSWAACDGSGTTIATATGGSQAVSTPNLSGGHFIRAGGSAAAVATAPTWDAAAKTELESSHNHGVEEVEVAAVESSTPVATVADNQVTQAGSPHQHTLTNTNAKINPPSDTAGGQPKNIGVNFVMRR
jgi:hypothetical protein